MLKSILLAGFFWATANFMPPAPVGPPTVVAHTAPAPISFAPLVAPINAVQLASLTTPVASARFALDIPQPESPSDGLNAHEREFVLLINEERTSRGLNPLSVDPMLVETARGHSREMCDLNYFDHHSPTSNLNMPMDRYLKSLHESGSQTPRYLLVGENIFYCSIFNDTYNVGYGHKALMDSPGHRANILDPRFARVGIGTYRNANGEFWVTEMFLKDTD